MRRAKIVATIGPAISSYENVTQAIQAGMNVARLNMSHGDHTVHNTSYENLRRASEELGTTVAILADLQGPKIRLGNFADGPHALDVGDTFTITIEDVPGSKELCSTTHKGLPG
ncbi:pyruvate kinase, partial [Kocuria sp. CPCC 205260]